MFKHTKQLACKVRVDEPNPIFAKHLQQAIGGVEGEIRVCLQCLFQGWGNRGPDRYKDMLLNTGTEEIGHIEMLATAVALNLEGASSSLQEEIAGKNGTVEAILGGQDPRHVQEEEAQESAYEFFVHSDGEIPATRAGRAAARSP